MSRQLAIAAIKLGDGRKRAEKAENSAQFPFAQGKFLIKPIMEGNRRVERSLLVLCTSKQL
jgi:hypothetical protein